MNIQNSTVITDLYFLDEIRVNGTEITLVRDTEVTYTVEQVTELRDALNAAIQAAGGSIFSPNLTGPWDRMEDIPNTVTEVWDLENDKWSLDETRGWKERAEWEGRANRYAPFRAQK